MVRNRRLKAIGDYVMNEKAAIGRSEALERRDTEDRRSMQGLTRLRSDVVAMTLLGRIGANRGSVRRELKHARQWKMGIRLASGSGD
jgi:hypothetical protein